MSRFPRCAALTAAALAALTVAACKSSADTASSSGTPPKVTSTAASTPIAPTRSTAPSSATGGGASTQCTAAMKTGVTALVTVPVGNPVNPMAPAGGGSNNAPDYACMYGIGANATTDATDLIASGKDTILVTVFGQGGADQYTGAVGVKFFPVTGVGDKAEYSFYAAAGQAPEFFALKGDVLCHVQINASDEPKQLGVPAQGSAGGILPAGAATVAQKEGAICTAVFGG